MLMQNVYYNCTLTYISINKMKIGLIYNHIKKIF